MILGVSEALPAPGAGVLTPLEPRLPGAETPADADPAFPVVQMVAEVSEVRPAPGAGVPTPPEPRLPGAEGRPPRGGHARRRRGAGRAGARPPGRPQQQGCGGAEVVLQQKLLIDSDNGVGEEAMISARLIGLSVFGSRNLDLCNTHAPFCYGSATVVFYDCFLRLFFGNLQLRLTLRVVLSGRKIHRGVQWFLTRTY